MQNQLKKIRKAAIEYGIEELNIITVSNNEHHSFKNLEVNVLPFYEWALS